MSPSDAELWRNVGRWALTPDGDAIVTPAAHLLPVRTAAGDAAMLKVSHEPEERFGAQVMAWWAGEGAARVLAHEGDALLMERATGNRSLADMATRGADDEAARIMCAVAADLHRPRTALPPKGLVPLDRWFQALFSAGATHGGVLARSAETARTLLASPRDVIALHGDLHHGNVLDFGPRGWLAIDPKGLLGERGFDFANLFCNPDPRFAAVPGRMARRLHVIADATGFEPGRMACWVLAWTGLSAVWAAEDAPYAAVDLSLVQSAAQLAGDASVSA